MQRAADVVAFLIDGGDRGFVPAEYTEQPEPWPALVEALIDVDPPKRAEIFEAAVESLDGRANEVRSAVYAALNHRLQKKRGAATLTAVAPALTDEKERLDLSVLKKAIRDGEDGDAAVFFALYEGQAAYDHQQKSWYLWQGHYWQKDDTNLIINLLRREVATQYALAALEFIKSGDGEKMKPFLKRAGRLHTRRRKEHVLWAAASLPGMALSGNEWDNDPWLLGTQNGVIDLRTGELRPGHPGDWIRTTIPTLWTGLDTPAPRWEQFLIEIFDNDRQLVNFMHRLLGYGITGSTSEHAFPLLYGPQGRNGKTTLLETLAAVMGPSLTMSIPAEEIMVSWRGGGTGPQPYVAKLRGKRLVWSSETNPDRRLDQETVKKLTGGDKIHAHAKYKNPIEFSPTHLLFLLTNHKPRVESADLAIWDRVHLVPFSLRFVDRPERENERLRDSHLPEKLRNEYSGILAWLVRGCLAWQKRGTLDPPERVRLATQLYRDEVDTIGQFIDDYCVLAETARVGHREIYKSYVRWCKDLRLWPSGSRDFGTTLKEQFEKKRMTTGMMYFGIGLPLNAPAGQMSLEGE